MDYKKIWEELEQLMKANGIGFDRLTAIQYAGGNLTIEWKDDPSQSESNRIRIVNFVGKLEEDDVEFVTLQRVNNVPKWNKEDRKWEVDEVYKGEAYCVRCKEKRYFEGLIKVGATGRRMAQGICPECGTKVNRILGPA